MLVWLRKMAIKLPGADSQPDGGVRALVMADCHRVPAYCLMAFMLFCMISTLGWWNMTIFNTQTFYLLQMLETKEKKLN